jgi:hypothetical protein
MHAFVYCRFYICITVANVHFLFQDPQLNPIIEGLLKELAYNEACLPVRFFT